MADKLPLGVEVVKDYIGIALMTGREYDDFTLLGEISQQIYCKWANIDSGVYLFTSGEFDLEGDIMWKA